MISYFTFSFLCVHFFSDDQREATIPIESDKFCCGKSKAYEEEGQFKLLFTYKHYKSKDFL